tara:strand:- start:1536 stop:1712 length:177 start_codon:yes stop_codon:yes gene_type:complete
MATLKKYGKTPKAGASLKTWDNYRARCIAVDKHNAGVKSDKLKKANLIKSVQKLKAKK